jgi:large subunit ribosomal protein L13
MNTKTYQPKQKEVKRNWHLIDVKDKVLGRSATQIAGLLMGKQKPTYSNHMDMGDYVVVVNAKNVTLTGKKEKDKVYYRHSGYPGGFREVKYSKLISEQPKKVIELAVSGMLPDNRLKQPRLRRMKVFTDTKHPYEDKLKSKD